MTSRILYLLGGAPRVGKSTLAQRLLAADGIPWLPSDVLRTVLRRIEPELDGVDQDPVDAARLAELMYHTSNKQPRCASRKPSFELAPTYPARLKAALPGTTVRACFLGHRTFSADDLAGYRGPKPQHETQASRKELDEAAAWIRQQSHQLHDECRKRGLPYIDVGTLGFHTAMQQARRLLLRRD